jgi:hypothetical protein
MLKERFEKKVVDFNAFQSNECWKWGGALKSGKEQYGKVHFRKDKVEYNIHAHRAMYVAVHKIMPDNLPLDISHICHQSLCVNPAHLVHEDRVVNEARKSCKDSGKTCAGHWFNKILHQPCIQSVN